MRICNVVHGVLTKNCVFSNFTDEFSPQAESREEWVGEGCLWFLYPPRLPPAPHPPHLFRISVVHTLLILLFGCKCTLLLHLCGCTYSLLLHLFSCTFTLLLHLFSCTHTLLLHSGGVLRSFTADGRKCPRQCFLSAHQDFSSLPPTSSF